MTYVTSDDELAACRQVAAEFPSVCGACDVEPPPPASPPPPSPPSPSPPPPLPPPPPEGCSSWCNERYRDIHCRDMACRPCTFCGSATATASPHTPLPHPPGLPTNAGEEGEYTSAASDPSATTSAHQPHAHDRHAPHQQHHSSQHSANKLSPPIAVPNAPSRPMRGAPPHGTGADLVYNHGGHMAPRGGDADAPQGDSVATTGLVAPPVPPSPASKPPTSSPPPLCAPAAAPRGMAHPPSSTGQPGAERAVVSETYEAGAPQQGPPLPSSLPSLASMTPRTTPVPHQPALTTSSLARLTPPPPLPAMQRQRGATPSINAAATTHQARSGVMDGAVAGVTMGSPQERVVGAVSSTLLQRTEPSTGVDAAIGPTDSGMPVTGTDTLVVFISVSVFSFSIFLFLVASAGMVRLYGMIRRRLWRYNMVAASEQQPELMMEPHEEMKARTWPPRHIKRQLCPPLPCAQEVQDRIARGTCTDAGGAHRQSSATSVPRAVPKNATVAEGGCDQEVLPPHHGARSQCVNRPHTEQCATSLDPTVPSKLRRGDCGTASTGGPRFVYHRSYDRNAATKRPSGARGGAKDGGAPRCDNVGDTAAAGQLRMDF